MWRKLRKSEKIFLFLVAVITVVATCFLFLIQSMGSKKIAAQSEEIYIEPVDEGNGVLYFDLSDYVAKVNQVANVYYRSIDRWLEQHNDYIVVDQVPYIGQAAVNTYGGYTTAYIVIVKKKAN